MKRPPTTTSPEASRMSGNVDLPVVGRTVAAVVDGTAAAVVAVGACVVPVGACVVVVDDVDGVPQAELVMTFESNVTAPLRANSRPLMVADVVAVIEVRASTVPTKVELVPNVAELPTCQ